MNIDEFGLGPDDNEVEASWSKLSETNQDHLRTMGRLALIPPSPFDISKRLKVFRQCMTNAGMNPDQPWPIDPQTNQFQHPEIALQVCRQMEKRVGFADRALEPDAMRKVKDLLYALLGRPRD